MEAPMRRLVRKLDNTGNTILHMTGIKRKDNVPERMDGPALVLQDEVKKVMLAPFMTHQNNMKLTAKTLFIASNNDLYLSSKEWLKCTAEGLPGGSNENTGFHVLINQPFFVVFTITDVISLTFSLASIGYISLYPLVC
ncbi:hypothetical protein ACOSQ3_016574 [Xanthoceras sorbifolium]